MTFQSVLVANRGEIACRIIRTLKELGLRSIAVYSDADKDALHVKLADEAVHIGGSSAAESYLNIEKIIEAAKTSGAQSLHPGYGFLSENSELARACEKAGLVFVGPSPDAIELMGDKAAAKRHMIEAAVPVLPGYQGELQDDQTLVKEAKKIGFPLMVKAAAGGGGRGMRLVTAATDLQKSIAAARSEALSSFGSDSLILERAVIRPRHVEIQVFGDSHGNIIHLGERDCSVQRRHQKVLEEAPCPVMTEELRSRMGKAAVKAARSVNYVGAGTVEFLLDEGGEFFFLEVNTRLQVEHPVTELVTGLDLVALQIRVSQGEVVGLVQDDVSLCGHAIEARLYAEEPAQGFLPATGRVEFLSIPNGVRLDIGVETGSDISPFYDPMIAKIIASGPDRETARRKLAQALEELAVFGVPTNRQFLIEALNKDAFISGKATTHFIGEAFSDEDLALKPLTPELAALASVTQILAHREQACGAVPIEISGWNSAHPISYPFEYDGVRVEVIADGPEAFHASCAGAKFSISLGEWAEGNTIYTLDGRRKSVKWFAVDAAEIFIQCGAASYHLVNSLGRPKLRESAMGKGEIYSPLHGALTEIFVKKGDKVDVGACLAVVEAMKMQHEILADISGVVADVFAAAGSQVAANAPLFKIDN